LQELPRGLNETYERILGKVPKTDTETVRRILMWLAFAVTPLKLEALHEAVAIEPGVDYIDEDTRLSSPQDILSLVGSLASVSDQGYVRLAHLSVKDFLLSSEICQHNSCAIFGLKLSDGNNELALNCLTYLFFKDLAVGPSLSASDYGDRLAKYPLFKHAAFEWTYYVRASSPSEEVLDLIHKFFNRRSGTFMSWVQVLNASRPSRWDVYPKHATPLYYAASFGLTDTVEALIRDGADLDAPGSRFGGTALHAATLREHIPAIKLLLEAGANPSKADFNLVSPLHSAAAYGNLEIIGLLLNFGASKDALTSRGEAPYDYAFRTGQMGAQKLLRDAPIYLTKANIKGVLGKVQDLEHRSRLKSSAVVDAGNGEGENAKKKKKKKCDVR
jgi:hypothetical protein